jgi:hypothetical protein
VPFPLLAHQAPVLPLKLWRPRLFSAVALCAGSIAPDFEYLRRPVRPGIGHSLLGQVVYCLPLSILITWLVARFVGPALASCLPRSARWRFDDLATLLNPFSGTRAFGVVAASCLVGSFSHILLDSFTHTDTWASRLFPVLRRLVPFFGTRIALALALQFTLSVVGAVVALLLMGRLLIRREAAAGFESPAAKGHRRTGGWLLMASTLVSMAVAVVSSRSFAKEPILYFQLGRLYVWGYVAFRASVAGFIGLTAAAIAVESRWAVRREGSPDKATRIVE